VTISADLGTRAARGAGVTLAAQGVRVALQFASVVVLARLLSPEDFGLVAMVTAVIGVADLVRDFGLSSAAVQSVTLEDEERTNLFWVNLALGVACTVVIVAARPLIVAAYGEPRITPVILALAVVFTLSGANTQYRSDLTRRMRFAALSASDIAAQAAGIAVAVVIALLGHGLWALVAQQLTAAVTALVVNVLTVRWLPGLPRRGVPMRRFFRFGAGLFSTQFLTYLTKNVDNVALGIVYGPVPLGFYSRAYQLLMMPLNQINAPMTNVALPVLSRIQHDDDAYQRYLERAQLVACYLTTTLFAVAAGLSAPLVLLLFGSGWTAVAPIFAILAIGGVFRSVAQIAYWIYLSRGETGAQLRLILWTRPIMIAIILAGLPWGTIGVAIGHSVAYFLYWLVSLVAVGRAARVDSGSLLRNARRSILYVSAPAGAVAWLATVLPVPPIAQAAVGVLAAAGYLAVAAALVPTVRADLALVLSFARRAAGAPVGRGGRRGPSAATA
jgi:polysaccharide transporter, PST family